ncbi:stonustoxin subunit beta-like [Astatotilapia calliptera]|uniref:stonustoxin subunit beta-like n=1 Tax=Astatotilapia calliptera TaxID=8154 RepID=UPI000E3FD23F|nr:stonustoxin subunit beta-like [Astatotilapia calliptera]
MDGTSGGAMEVAALGRPFSVGMLYDCRSDALVPGMTLWDRDDLIKDVGERPQAFNDFDIVASESISDKCSALNVDGSLKTSFLGGLVQVSGSAKYLKDTKSSRNQARVTLKYKATTKIQELSMNHLGRGNVKHPYVFDQGLATHVVTAILYGAQAFFVFDREVSEQENHQDVQGNLKVTIEKIPKCSVEGEGSLKMEKKDKESVDEFFCRFYGDFCLPKPPTTFQGAVEVYQSLPELLGDKAVPVKVWLLPLTCLDSSAAKLVRQISTGLVQEAQRVLEDFSELEMRYNDVLRTSTAQKFPQIDKKLKSFKEMCSEFKLDFQQTLAKKLPSIRGGGEEEAELAEILKKRHSSPFSSKNLDEWMDCKEREVDTLMSFTRMMKNTKIISSQNDLYKESLSAEHVVCFVFTSLGKDEPYLSALSRYLRGKTNPDLQDPHSHDVEKEQWYALKEVTAEMRRKAKLFSDFAEANKENKNMKFLTVGLTNETQEGSSIHLYEGGFAVSENFEPPSKPETVTVADINHNSVTLKISPPRFGAENITSYSVEYCVSGEDGWQQKTEAKAEEVTVRDLKPNTEYVLRCRAVISAGVGPDNQVSIKTTSSGRNKETCLAEKLRDKSEKIKSDSPSVYKLPLTEEHMNIDGCRKFNFGEETEVQNRTIMLFGATGSGKSTLINGMINYIVGVEWEDSFRFKLINEDQSTSQAHSQTSEVTVYKINHQEGFKIPFSLTIVDTPGFGDTRGIERDRETVEQLRNLFTSSHGVTEIDAVCFVAPAALARITPTQNYVFDSVLSIFGKDVAENIRILVTFADVQQPPVLETINAAGVPCPKTEDKLPVHFKFNNSALFAHNRSSEANCGKVGDERRVNQMFWEMGAESMKSFFAALNQMETKSLTLTMEVLRERKQLEISVENIQEKLKRMEETSEKLEHVVEIKDQRAKEENINSSQLAWYRYMYAQVMHFIELVVESVKKLAKWALKPNPSSTPEYIDMLIEGEKSEAKPGCMERVQSLMERKKECVLIFQFSKTLNEEKHLSTLNTSGDLLFRLARVISISVTVLGLLTQRF